ncbi:adenine phosphoribosyltransferase [Spiroplasma sp. TIUS-1]|uniref:adenine phosphoribosyltransferase n=1 Tax=Spiroplasma sp. TIUS-1 TaxID=216963 RepID=UPI0013991031|nr:adenine phosphoribosyltransferase [Spiroplasma sp. TIUS-1]QHX35951.1 adenine phosphoribosyltransferase [Spiroplasma sp. TIUS-1]
MDLRKYVIDVEDFPKKGITFKDITPILNNAEAFKFTIDEIVKYAKEKEANVIVGSEARGFIFAAPAAYAAGMRFIPARKPGKLPRPSFNQSYELEYNESNLSIHRDDIKPSDRVLIVDDLLATGGTVKAQVELIKMTGATTVGAVFLIDLVDLHSKDVFNGIDYKSILKY